MTLGPTDERAHAPGAASWWWETWHLDAANEDGVGVAVRLACAPALGLAWWWTHLFLPDVAGSVVVRDHEVGLPRQGLEVRADGLWGELICEAPFEHWTYGLEAFGVRLDDPADSLRGEIGERVAVGLDIEWEIDAVTHSVLERGDAAEPVGYEQFGRVHGEILVGRSSFELDAVGLRSHTWGTPHFDRASQSAWFHSASGSESISGAHTETRRRADGLPVGARYVVSDQLAIDAEVVGLVTIPLVGPGGEGAVLSRGLCRYAVEGEVDAGTGHRGIGWSTWLDPA
jgi:hypothetical protein